MGDNLNPMRKFIYISILLIGAITLSNCGDVLEEDLSDQQVILLAPADNVISDNQSQTLWWEELDDIFEGYKIRIVAPSFDSIVNLVEEAEVVQGDGNTYEVNLAEGTYEWTVVAYNSSSETMPLIRTLIIGRDTSNDLSGQIVELQTPLDDMFTNKSDIDFLWSKLNDADSYRIQLAEPDFSNSSFIIADELTEDDFLSVTDLAEGSYLWRVRGENDKSVTSYTMRAFTVDQSAPVAPTLIRPMSGDTVSIPVTLDWEVDAESVMDTLYIYSDSLGSPPVFVLPTTATSYSFNQADFSKYYWRVRSVDAAGNTSLFSVLRRFHLN